MTKSKVLFGIGTILLFIGLALSPATARLMDNDLIEDKFEDLEIIIPKLMDEIEKTSSAPELINVLTDFMNDYRGHPVLDIVMKIIREVLDIMNRINRLRPLNTNAFILSWGFANKINPFKENKLQLYRPLTAWHYSGKSNLILNSRTIIIDFQPFKIKMLTGRQFGFMRNFAGIYLHRETTLTDKSYTFFMGKSATIRGFDLSFLNVLGQ